MELVGLGQNRHAMATFLLEVGTEELPASFVSDAMAQWRLVEVIVSWPFSKVRGATQARLPQKLDSRLYKQKRHQPEPVVAF